MKTKTQIKNRNGSELESRSEQLSKGGIAKQQKGTAVAAQRPFVSFKQRAFNRTLSTERVLAALERWMPRQYDLAYVVGDWIWIQFSEAPTPQIRQQISELGFHWNSKRQLWQHPCGKGINDNRKAA